MKYDRNSIVEHNETTQSLSDWAEEVGISVQNIVARANSIDDMSKWFLPAHTLKKGYEIDGKLYSLKEVSDLCGIKYSTLRYRMRRGMTLEQAIKKPTEIKFVKPEVKKENPNLTELQREILRKFRGM